MSTDIFSMPSGSTFAFLVDGENISRPRAEEAAGLARLHGQIAIGRVYGKPSQLNAWKDAEGYEIVPVEKGKNAADLAIAIDAVDLSHRGGIDGFALVTSDGDFVQLARHLVARGFPVLGIGPAHTSGKLRSICSKFLPLAPTRKEAARHAASIVVQGKVRKVFRKHSPEQIEKRLATIIRGSHKTRGAVVANIAVKMVRRYEMRVSLQPERNWERFIKARPQLYILDASDRETRVRLREE